MASQSAYYATIKNWVIIEYVGDDSGLGRQSCYKDIHTENCVHIAEARLSLQKQLGIDLGLNNGVHGDIESECRLNLSIRKQLRLLWLYLGVFECPLI